MGRLAEILGGLYGWAAVIIFLTWIVANGLAETQKRPDDND